MDKQQAADLLFNISDSADTVRAWVQALPETPFVFPSVPVYGQQWQPWGGDRLGYSSNSTIAGWGCVVTCAAMLTSHFAGRRVTPRDLNERMKAVGGFVNTNLFVWWKLGEAFPEVHYDGAVYCQSVPAPVDKVDAHLAGGGLCVACLDFKLRTGGVQTHWVLLVQGAAETFYWVNDPWIGARTTIPTAYGEGDWLPQRSIYAVAFYSRA